MKSLNKFYFSRELVFNFLGQIIFRKRLLFGRTYKFFRILSF